MKKIAIAQAQERLGRAQRAFEALKNTQNFDQFGSAWTDFLLAFSGVYSKLQKGAVSNPRSMQWFGGKKRERTKDSLLCYVNQARNADEHGIEPTTERVPGGIGIGAGGEAVHIAYAGPDGKGGFVVRYSGAPGRPPPTVTRYPATVELKQITDDRFGTTFDPPKEHLGQPIDPKPLIVANLALKYLEALVDEASKLSP